MDLSNSEDSQQPQTARPKRILFLQKEREVFSEERKKFNIDDFFYPCQRSDNIRLVDESYGWCG